MGYITATGIFAFLAIMFVFISIVIKHENKKALFNNFILGNKNEIYRLSNLFVKISKPLMPSKEKREEVRKYLNELSLKEYTPERIYTFAIIAGILMGIMYFAVLSLVLNQYIAISGLLIGVVFGYKMPIILLKSKYKKMQEEKQMGILPYIEMLQVACDAGLTLTLAIERVYEYYPSSLALEFKKANNDFMANIKTRRQSFQEIIQRVGGDEIRLLIESLIQSLDIGTPMKTTLKNLSDIIRRDLQRVIIGKGQKAKWKNFIVSVCFQFPPFIFIIAGPGIAGIMDSL